LCSCICVIIISEVDVKIRVFPLEPVLQEFFRCAATIRTFKQRGYGHLCQDPDAPLKGVFLRPEDYEFIMEKATEDHVYGAVVGPHPYNMKNWDCCIRFACGWHQKVCNIKSCGTNSEPYLSFS